MIKWGNYTNNGQKLNLNIENKKQNVSIKYKYGKKTRCKINKSLILKRFLLIREYLRMTLSYRNLKENLKTMELHVAFAKKDAMKSAIKPD